MQNLFTEFKFDKKLYFEPSCFEFHFKNKAKDGESAKYYTEKK